MMLVVKKKKEKLEQKGRGHSRAWARARHPTPTLSLTLALSHSRDSLSASLSLSHRRRRLALPPATRHRREKGANDPPTYVFHSPNSTTHRPPLLTAKRPREPMRLPPLFRRPCAGIRPPTSIPTSSINWTQNWAPNHPQTPSIRELRSGFASFWVRVRVQQNWACDCWYLGQN